MGDRFFSAGISGLSFGSIRGGFREVSGVSRNLFGLAG